jgi:arylsulfatase A-like enzyme
MKLRTLSIVLTVHLALGGDVFPGFAGAETPNIAVILVDITNDRGQDGYRGDLNGRCVTIADVLRGAGYRTMMTGKWHVTKFVNASNDMQKANWPLQRGFGHYLGIIQGAANYFRPSR